jgi:hypothetical protein
MIMIFGGEIWKIFYDFPPFCQNVELVSSFDDFSRKKNKNKKPNWLHPQFKKPNNKISKIHN